MRCCGCTSSSIPSGPVRLSVNKWFYKRNQRKIIQEQFQNLVRIVDFFLSGDVGVVISQTKETIVVHQIVVDITEFIRVIGTEEAGINLIDNLSKTKRTLASKNNFNFSDSHLFQFGVGIVVVESVVTSFFKRFYFILFHAENENIFFSHFFGHFNIGSIKGTNSQGTVQLNWKASVLSFSAEKQFYKFSVP